MTELLVASTLTPAGVLLQVMRGSAPVLDAEVYGVITGVDNEVTRIPLLDNGLGGKNLTRICLSHLTYPQLHPK